MTDVALFDGVQYDRSEATDHFFSDDLRKACDSCYANDNVIPYDTLEKRIAEDRGLDHVIAFFDGLVRSEPRYRWDRTVALHLLVVGFINKFGYPEQRSSADQISQILAQFRNPEIPSNLNHWLRRLGLAGVREFQQIGDAINTRVHARRSEHASASASA